MSKVLSKLQPTGPEVLQEEANRLDSLVEWQLGAGIDSIRQDAAGRVVGVLGLGEEVGRVLRVDLSMLKTSMLGVPD